MKDNYTYKYDDPDHLYTDPKTGVLRNKLGITDNEILQMTEGIEVGRKLEELEDNPITVKSADTLLTIHGCLFQNLYEWAGKVRAVNISKQGKPFLPVTSFSEGFAYINSLIKEYRSIGSQMNMVAGQLATILDSVNYLHPFREGNGRTQREFIRVLALEKDFLLNLNPAADKSVYECYMKGTIEGDVSMLAELIEKVMIKVWLSEDQ
jgi:cell filamentation protein